MYIVRKCLIKADSGVALNSAKSEGNKREAKRGRMDRGDKKGGGRGRRERGGGEVASGTKRSRRKAGV